MTDHTGVHIEAVGVNKWKMTGKEVVHLFMEENQKTMSIKWVVASELVEARYGTAGVALAHAYQIAKGHTARQAESY